MPQAPTPPTSSHPLEYVDDTKEESSAVSSSDALLQSLDSLLERYLWLLDHHQKLQAELAKQLSSGFLSLAHANCTGPPGRWYGADYYDERMKATRKISLQLSLPSDSATKPTSELESASLDNYKHIFSIESTTNQLHQAGEDAEAEPPQSATHSPKDQLVTGKQNSNSANATDSSDCPEYSENSKETATHTTSKEKKKFRSLDPITWYGILVPPALRSAQKSFMGGVEGQVPALASVVVEMRAVEREVERVRQALDK